MDQHAYSQPHPFPSRAAQVLSFVRSMLSDFTELIAPPPQYCFLCNRTLPAPALPVSTYYDDICSSLCLQCMTRLPWVQPPLCPQCGRPWRNGGLCRFCTQHKVKLHGTSPLVYTGLAKELVHQLKFRSVCELGEPLGWLMGAAVANVMDHWSPHAVVPIPLYGSRMEQRGYNQAELLALGVGQFLQCSVWNTALERVKPTVPQSSLSLAERFRNVHAAFSVPITAQVANRRLLLVDDVHTTGATLSGAMQELLLAGAESVRFVTLAVAVSVADVT